MEDPADFVSTVESRATRSVTPAGEGSIEGAGHWVTYEAADEVNAALVELLSRQTTT